MNHFYSFFYKKRTQILIFDLILSSIIIIISLGIIFSYYFSNEDNSDIYTMNLNILNGFTLTKINSLNDDKIRNLFISGQIKNIENSIANQIAEFYYFNETELARNLSRIYVSSYALNKYNIEISLINSTGNEFILYEDLKNKRTFQNSKVSSRISREIMGFVNLNENYGPYEFTIKLWY